MKNEVFDRYEEVKYIRPPLPQQIRPSNVGTKCELCSDFYNPKPNDQNQHQEIKLCSKCSEQSFD